MNVIAIDGGGTNTVAAVARIADDGEIEVRGRSRTGASNPSAIGLEASLATIEQAVADALADARCSDAESISAAVVAVAGGERADFKEGLRVWSRQRPIAARVEIVHDAMPLLALESPDVTGIAVVAGTGAIVFGRRSDGRTARSGGWGYILGDDGSGFRIAADALRAVLSDLEGRGETTILAAMLATEKDLFTAEDILGFVYGGEESRIRVASLAPLVITAAAAQDPVAERIVNTAAIALAEHVATVASRLEFTSGFPVVCSGGVLQHGSAFRVRLQAALAKRNIPADPLTVAIDPILGGLKLAALLATNRWPSITP